MQPELVVAALKDCPIESMTPKVKAVLALAQVTAGAMESLELLQEVASQNPDAEDPFWLSDVGLACLLTGNVDKACDLLQQATRSSLATAVDFGRLAAVYLAQGDLEQARIHYQEAVDREPGHAVWHSNLAGILVRQQRLEEALAQYEAALRLDPDLVQAQQGRTSVLVAMERTEELVEELTSRLKQDPDSLETRLQLARLMDLDNQLTEAVRTLREAFVPVDEITPPPADLPLEQKKETEWWKQIALRAELARIFMERSRPAMALHLYRQIEKLQPENPVPCFVGQASAQCELGEYQEALELLSKAEAFLKEKRELPEAVLLSAPSQSLPETPGTFLNIELVRSHILCESGEYEKAEEILREQLKTYPGHAGLLSSLGQTLLWTGKLDEAAELFQEAAKVNPMALAQLVSARRMPEDEQSIEVMRQVADNPLYNYAVRSNMAFALAEVFEKRGEYADAWHYLDLANSLVNKRLNYDPKAFSRRVDDNCLFFTKAFFAKQERIRLSDRTPIFVVGMPRSGTTLTEQILCSHPQIYGAGELDIMSRLVYLMPRVLQSKEHYPFCMEALTPHLREEAARFYLYRLKFYDTEHEYVVDKMPHNFMHLGLIAIIFPKAKIIHVRRDPRDTALSNYQQNFKARHGGLGYAFDLEKLAMQLNDYHRMMKHWRAVLPIPMFEFRYEDLVEDLATWSRKLIEFVGLEWDESMMEFYKTQRAVRTASVSQVRQPIYKTSKQKWRKYEAYMKPFFDNLNPKILEEWEA
ncbi:tetratricopeptide repeat-containing sulfotransferase family protein [Desulfosoma caldarium]|nr:tetratricopeptide repeat-containing sulfotransferase family protein [Desulfosoma caldarium]